MLNRFLALSVTFILLMPLAAAAEDAGVNRTIDVEGTPIALISAPEVSTDGVEFVISVELSEAAKENGTTVQWTVQQCLNSGVCDPPKKLDMAVDDAGVWTDTLTPVKTHSYVNYDIILTYPDSDDSEKFPRQGFSKGGKVWSDCWVSGEDSGGDNCPSEEGGDAPAPGLVAGIGAALLAAMIARRED